MSDHERAGEIADAAGRLLLRLRARGDGDPRALRDLADAESNRLILAELAAAFPGEAVLSEESADDPARLTAERVWIVDPLDGTREYGEPGRTDWAVHVALVERGAPVAGAVALPARGLVLTSGDPPPPARRHDPPRLVVSRSRPPAVAEAIRAAVGGELIPLGSAGAKAMAVVLGEAEVYAHAGGQHEWDSAAPVAVAAAAGLHVSRLDGSPLVYNQPDPWLPDLLICRPDLAEVVIAAAAAA
jgi:3'(2'), 5'-bisphosphate nucleotidase